MWFVITDEFAKLQSHHSPPGKQNSLFLELGLEISSFVWHQVDPVSRIWWACLEVSSQAQRKPTTPHPPNTTPLRGKLASTSYSPLMKRGSSQHPTPLILCPEGEHHPGIGQHPTPWPPRPRRSISMPVVRSLRTLSKQSQIYPLRNNTQMSFLSLNKICSSIEKECLIPAASSWPTDNKERGNHNCLIAFFLMPFQVFGKPFCKMMGLFQSGKGAAWQYSLWT